MEMIKSSQGKIFHKLKSWYQDEESVVLSEKETAFKNRLAHIWALRLNNKYSTQQTITVAMKEHDISQATAYRDYKLAQQLFGEIDQVDIAAERIILAEAYWNLYQRAISAKNFDEARKALDSYKSLFNWADDDQVVDPKKLEASVYRMVLPRGVGKVINAMFESGVADFNSLGAEDVDFKEVEETEEEPNDE